MSPYHLVYGKPCHLLVELEYHAYWVIKHLNQHFQTAGDHKRLQLSKLELRNDAYEVNP